MSDAGVLQGAIILIISYVLGHLTQAVASPIDEWFIRREPFYAENAGLPYPFEHKLNQVDTDGGSVTHKVKTGLDEFFDPGLSGYELFFATQSYLWNNDIGRMRRFQTLYTLFRSLYFLLVVGGVLHWVGLIASVCGVYQSTWSPIELGILGGILLILAGIMYRRRVRFHKEMAKMMIFDFYANVLSQDG
ncbi:hypothetical protein [Halorubrum sp. FL23]|uniref:hypothetical protein n=1 Tax=Halorubrum sp. FL23 TaxID=3458704 RepID=UPI004033B207